MRANLTQRTGRSVRHNGKPTGNSNPIAETSGNNDRSNTIDNHADKTIGNNDHNDEISNRNGRTTGNRDHSNKIGNRNLNNSKHRLRNNSQPLTRSLLHPFITSKEHHSNSQCLD